MLPQQTTVELLGRHDQGGVGPLRPVSSAECSSTPWTDCPRTQKGKEKLADGEGSENPGKRPVWGPGGRVSHRFPFLSGLEPKAGSQQSSSHGTEVAKNQEKVHLSDQRTRKMQVGEYGVGGSPPSFESWDECWGRGAPDPLESQAGWWYQQLKRVEVCFSGQRTGKWVPAVQKVGGNARVCFLFFLFLFFPLSALPSERQCGQLELLRETRPLGQRIGRILERKELEGDPLCV